MTKELGYKDTDSAGGSTVTVSGLTKVELPEDSAAPGIKTVVELDVEAS